MKVWDIQMTRMRFKLLSKIFFLSFIVLGLSACSTNAVKKLDDLTGSKFYVEPNEESSAKKTIDSVSTTQAPTREESQTKEANEDSKIVEIPDSNTQAEIQQVVTPSEMEELELLHYKVSFRVRSLKKLEDWNEFQLQVLENFHSTLKWISKSMSHPDFDRQDLAQATTDVKRIRHSLLNLNDWKMTNQASDSSEQEGVASQSSKPFSNDAMINSGVNSPASQQVEDLPDWETAHISWVGRFNELQNQARMGYTWKQLKDDIAQVERSPDGPALAEPIQKLISMVQKRDRKEIVNLLFEIDMSLDSGKVQAAQRGIHTLIQEYPDYHKEFPLQPRQERLEKLELNLLGESAVLIPLPKDSSSVVESNSLVTSTTVDSSENQMVQVPTQVDPTKASKLLEKADTLLADSKWLEARDLMRTLVNSQFTDEASQRIKKASEAYCTDKRSEAAKYMAQARGRGMTRQKKFMSQALESLNHCAKEFPGSEQADKVKDNIKMLQERI